jgi:hypothetical protein
MLRSLIALSLILTLGACDSRLNPLNWFGGDREVRVSVDPDATGPEAAALDPRALVTEVTQLSVEQTTTGAVIRVTGVTPVQGYFDVGLRELGRENGELVYEFRAAEPDGNLQPGLQTIVAGERLTMGELQGIRSITVIGQNNRRTVSRR